MHEKIREYPLPDDYRGSYDEMRQLLSHLGITDSQTLGRLNDNFMSLMNKHTTIDVFALEDYIQSTFADQDNNVSLSEFLAKHDPENLPLWEFYCGVSDMHSP